MVTKGAPTSVVIVAPARAVAALRAMVDALGSPYARSTAIQRSTGRIGEIVAAARTGTPAFGVVSIVTSEDEADAHVASGVDEVLVEPFDERALLRALKRAALRSGLRADHLVEARTLEQVLAGVTRSTEGPLAALALDLDALHAGTVLETATAGPEEVDLALEDCSAAIDHVARVLREAAVLAADRRREVPEPIAVPPLVDQVLRVLGGAEVLGAHVEVHQDPNLPKILAPRRLLARTLAQVLVQALDAVQADEPALRRLRISLRAPGESVAIALEVRPSLDAPPPSTPLTLGLDGRIAVAREAMRSFDGELVAERSSDGGVRLVVFAPRVQGPSHERMSPTHTSGTHLRPSRPRVLVVDANERVLRAASRALAERFDVLVSTTGEEALALAREGSIDVAVLDLRLPDMAVELLVDELRRIDPRLGARVAFIGGAGDDAPEAGRVSSIEAPVLVKPVRRTALLAALETLLGNEPRETMRPLRVLN